MHANFCYFSGHLRVNQGRLGTTKCGVWLRLGGVHPLICLQLSRFVMEERQRHTVYPAHEDVFAWTRCCDIDKVWH